MCRNFSRHAKQNAARADNVGMKCIGCRRRSVSASARLGTKYCSSACRSIAYRARHKQERLVEVQEQDRVTEADDARKAPRITARRTDRTRRRKLFPDVDRGETSGSVPVSRVPRIAFVEQLRKQQPEGAAGYRLALPTRSPADTPKIVPVPDSQGGVRYWRLAPFEVPDDIRLQDGLSYRVLWVDGVGQPLAPTTPYVPSLTFFLGPPESEQDKEDAAYAAILRDVSDPELRKKIEAEIARSRLDSQRLRERTEVTTQQIANRERMQRVEERQQEAHSRWAKETQAQQERLDAQLLEKQAKEAAEREKQEKFNMKMALGVGGGALVVTILTLVAVELSKRGSVDWQKVGEASLPLLQKAAAEIPARNQAGFPQIAPSSPNKNDISSAKISENTLLATLLRNPLTAETLKTLSEQKRQIISELLLNKAGHLDEALFSIVKPTSVLFNPVQEAMAGRSVSPTVRDLLADEDIRRFIDDIVLLSEKGSETCQSNPITNNSNTGISDKNLQQTGNQALVQAGSSESNAERATPSANTPAPDSGEITTKNTASTTVAPQEGLTNHGSQGYSVLSGSQVVLICGIILDAEKLAQANYEIRRLQVNNADDSSLKEPFVEISGDERKEIRRVVTDPGMQKVLLRLRDEFDAACKQGGEAVFALPLPFTSLQPSEGDKLRLLIQSPEHRAYVTFQKQRREAMMTAQPPPLPIATRLSDKEQKAIRKQLRDRRALAYVGALMAESTGQASPV